YEVYVVADAVGGTSVAAHEMALRRIEQAGGKMISWAQLLCELQRDWAWKETGPAFMGLFIETGGGGGPQVAAPKEHRMERRGGNGTPTRPRMRPPVHRRSTTRSTWTRSARPAGWMSSSARWTTRG